MNEEMATIVKNKTWEMVNLPNGKETIGQKWIFKIKYNEDGSVQKYKAHLKGIAGAERESYNLWYLDSGCSNHMTGERDIFISLDQSFNSQVKLGDGKMQKAVGKGTIAVHTKGGNKKLISDVLYVPNLTQNLLSVGQLIQKGFLIYFDDEKCKIIDKTNNHTVAVVEMSKNKVFPLVMPLDENVALKTENSDLSNLWHLRYGHLNYKGLNLLKQKNMVIGLPDVGRYEKVCEGCIYGKMHRLPFPKNSRRAKAPLELVHADICGPTRTLSLNNKRYFIFFVDDYTRMMWIYFLSEKSEAFSTFLQFKALAERQSGCKMKTLRTDRGGEFIYTPFMNYCRDNGIQRQLTVSRSPQQNRVAERKNRTIVEMARSMLKGKGIPNNLWAKACHTAVYILNRSPTKAVRDKTPFEAWHSQKPIVDHLKIFGSIAYALIPAQSREKFDEKGEKYLFIGYSDESKGYRLLNPTTNKLVISRDVVFDEASAWQWVNDQSQASSFFEAPVSPPNSSQQNNLEPNFPNSAAESSSDDESPPRKIKSMREIYESSRMETIRTVLALAAQMELHVFQLDVKSTFLNGEIEEEVYVEQPKGYEVKVSVLSRFMNDPRKSHYIAAKRILRKSTSGYLFCLGTNVISWSSRKQKSVALSSAEAEYIAATESVCEAVWLRRILKDLQFNQDAATTIYCDNMSAIALTKNPVFHAKSKHIELRYHYIRDLVSKGEVNMEFISTNEQPADFLTKAIIIEKFEKFKKQLKITN
ncbi:hypothetical protein KPL70_008169 [Citrus sinensis]|nr:hypothetical protein KPL70_008169 [Citrus sinensis]